MICKNRIKKPHKNPDLFGAFVIIIRIPFREIATLARNDIKYFVRNK